MATLAVHVTPKAGKNQVVGVRASEEGLLEVSLRVTAAPDAGKANAAVCKLLAKELGLARLAVCIKRGETSRHKLLEINAEEEKLNAWLAQLPTL